MQYPGFKERCSTIIAESGDSWENVVTDIRQGITKWEKEIPKPNMELKEIEVEMAQIQQLSPDLL